MKESENIGRSRIRSPEVIVPVIGLAYTDLYFVYLALQFASRGQFPGFLLMLVPFMIVFLLGAIGVWRISRWGYIVSAVISAFFTAFYSSFILDAFSNPADPAFVGVVTIIPALVAAFVYSILGLRMVWRRPAQMMPRAMVPKSSVIAFAILGFVVGGLAVGLAAGGTQVRLLSSSGVGDVVIVQGASSSTNSQFYTPQSFTVKAGGSVTWVNRDASTHTVTDTNGAFDSGNIASGGNYEFAFTKAGTYQYYCTIHPWMKGTIVVQP